jgi:hypothetical protein
VWRGGSTSEFVCTTWKCICKCLTPLELVSNFYFFLGTWFSHFWRRAFRSRRPRDGKKSESTEDSHHRNGAKVKWWIAKITRQFDPLRYGRKIRPATEVVAALQGCGCHSSVQLHYKGQNSQPTAYEWIPWDRFNVPPREN